MDVFRDYHEAYEAARLDAVQFNRPMGLEAAREYGKIVYRVKMIPINPAQRCGWETCCEVVLPTDPKCEGPRWQP